MMKKFIIILAFCAFLISGCDAKYELSYNENVFHEVLYVNNYKIDDDMLFLIDHFKNDKIYGDVNDKISTAVKVTEKSQNLYNLKFNTSYSSKDYVNSLAIETCFEFHSYEEDDDTLYINLYGDYYCDKFENLKIVFKSDKKINYSNAHNVSFGNYVWNYKADDDINIEIEIDKNKAQFNLYLLYPFFGILILLLIIYGVYKLYVFFKRNKEV